MKKGINKIIDERDEQLNEHDYDYLSDQNEFNQNRELAMAAAYCLTLDIKLYPSNWGNGFMNSILGKQDDFEERHKIAGALCAAQLDFDEIKKNKPPYIKGDKIIVIDNLYYSNPESKEFLKRECVLDRLWFNDNVFEWWAICEQNEYIQYAEWHNNTKVFTIAQGD